MGVDVEALAAKCRDMVIEELLRDRRLRRELLLAVARESATRQDLENAKSELRREIDQLRRGFEELRRDVEALKRDVEVLKRDVAQLREEVNEVRRELRELRGEVARLSGSVAMLTRAFIAVNVPTLLAVIGILLRMVFTGP